MSAGRSELASLLISDIGTGKTCWTSAQKYAKATVAEVSHAAGVSAHPSTEKIAALGAGGRQAGNCCRGGTRMLNASRKKKGMVIEPFHVPLTVKKLRGDGEEEILHPVLAPHELPHTIFSHGNKRAWDDGILGPDGIDELQRFWDHERKLPWCHGHPALRDESLLRTTVPIGLHGDGVQDQKDHKVLVMSWNSVTGRAGTWDSRFLYSALSSRRICPGRSTVWQLLRHLVWSINVGFTGVSSY